MSPRAGVRRHLAAYATGGFGLATNAMIQFLLPLRADALGIGITVIGVLLGAKAFTEALMSVPLGSFMDRVGHRRAYRIGAGGSALVGLGFFLAPSAPVLLLLQVLLGIARPLAWVSAQSYVTGLHTGETRARDAGRFSFCANVAQIAAPLLAGGAAQLWGVRAAFLVFAAYAGAFWLLGFALPDTADGGDSAPAKALATADGGGRTRAWGGVVRGFSLLRLRGIQVAMLLSFTRLWVPGSFNAFLPLYLVSSGISEALAGSAVSVMAVVSTVIALLAGRIARLGRPEPLTASALAVAALGLALAPLSAALWWIYLSAMLVGVGQGLSLPMLLTIVSNAAPDGQRGLALGLRSSVNQVAATIAPITVAGVIGVAGITVGFPVAAAIAGAVLAVAGAVDRWRPRDGAAPA